MSDGRWKTGMDKFNHWTLSRDNVTKYFQTKEKLEATLARWRANGQCRECAELLDDGWIEEVKQRVLTERLCHNCLIWTDLLTLDSGLVRVVVDGEHYSFRRGDDGPGRMGFTGFGGRAFTIHWRDDTPEETTRNLWRQGTIPDHFRDRFPNNADFV